MISDGFLTVPIMMAIAFGTQKVDNIFPGYVLAENRLTVVRTFSGHGYSGAPRSRMGRSFSTMALSMIRTVIVQVVM